MTSSYNEGCVNFGVDFTVSLATHISQSFSLLFVLNFATDVIQRRIPSLRIIFWGFRGLVGLYQVCPYGRLLGNV